VIDEDCCKTPIEAMTTGVDLPQEQSVDFWNSRGFLTQETENWRMYVDRNSGKLFRVSNADNKRYENLLDLHSENLK